jgi:hypothetical protein
MESEESIPPVDRMVSFLVRPEIPVVVPINA